MASFSGLDWDGGNLAKCQKHGVSIEEIERLFAGAPRYSPDVAHSAAEQRLIAVGLGRSRRPLFVVFTFRESEGRLLVRPISARYMHAKEAARWAAQGSGDED